MSIPCKKNFDIEVKGKQFFPSGNIFSLQLPRKPDEILKTDDYWLYRFLIIKIMLRIFHEEINDANLFHRK